MQLAITKSKGEEKSIALGKLTFEIVIKGQVQGVGFRPFVYSLAIKNKVHGLVINDSNGVSIQFNGSEKLAKKFLKSIIDNAPIASEIISSELKQIEPLNFTEFKIGDSEKNNKVDIPLTPDFAICESCKAEILDPTNRRHYYPFTTCVNCGPRYSITKNFPFERENTSLHTYDMCDLCAQEYKNPQNSRYHSQTNSCSKCGVELLLKDHNGEILQSNSEQVLLEASSVIKKGFIVAIKNTNGYVLCCDAKNKKAIETLRQRKNRPKKPFAVLYKSIELIEEDFKLTTYERKALTSKVAPIVLLKNNTNFNNICIEQLAPGLNETGVLMPSSALLYQLLNLVETPLVCTSGNMHGSPIIAQNDKAQQNLQSIADYFVDHELSIEFPQDDSVVKFSNSKQIILRRSRGYAPNYLNISNRKESNILAMGAHQKSTFSIIPNKQLYVSQYFGNLDNILTLNRFNNILKKQLSIFKCTPKNILIDKHPNYQSSDLGKEIAKELGANLHEIQHHKAHFCSVLGEHELFSYPKKILGVIWDGNGYGDDNNVWGGEFFIYKKNKITRTHSFKTYKWILGDKMSKEPRLALLSLLDHSYLNDIKEKFNAKEWKVYTKIKDSNSVKTSSVGRLIDAVSSALNLVDFNSYEAEGALQLERCAWEYNGTNYVDLLEGLTINNEIPTNKIVSRVYRAFKSGEDKNKIAASFLFSLSLCILKISEIEKTDIIACSGGVFQNSYLIKSLSKLCEENKKKLKLNCKLSSNDENISFGQIMYYQNIRN